MGDRHEKAIWMADKRPFPANREHQDQEREDLK